MAQASAFGISGYDPIMSSVEGWVNSYFDKKAEKRAYQRQLQLMAAQYEYSKRYAENSPSWNVKGLRDAGLNPILAVSNGAHLGSTVPTVPTATSHRSPNNAKASFSGSGLLPFDRRMTKQNADATTLAAQAADKQADAALIKAQTDAGESASRIAKTIAETALSKQDFERNKGNGGWRQDWMADGHRLMMPFYESLLFLGKQAGKAFYNSVKERWNSENDARPYLQQVPLRSIEPTKHDESKEYEYNGRKYRFKVIPKD